MSKSKEVTAADIETLPSRFRHYILSLQGRLRDFEQAQAQQEPTRIIVEPYDAKRYLDDRAMVRYVLEDHRYVDVTLCQFKFGGPTDRHVLALNGCRTLALTPAAANMIYVELED